MSDELRELYQEVILDHGKNPRNFYEHSDATNEARGSNPLCGDQRKTFREVEAKLTPKAADSARSGAVFLDVAFFEDRSQEVEVLLHSPSLLSALRWFNEVSPCSHR